MAAKTYMKLTTPAMARRLLEGMNGNRNLRESVVDAYARDMVAGNWGDAGDAIGLDENGTLVSGQHRLHAVVKSGCPIRFRYVEGITREDHRFIDTGIVRNLADELQYQGEVNTHQLGAAVANLWRYDHEITAAASRTKATHSELLDHLKANPDLRHFVTITTGRFPRFVTKGPLAAVSYIAARDVATTEAEGWLAALKSDVPVDRNDPNEALRRFARNAHDRHAAVSRVEWMALNIKTFNAYLRGEKVTNLRWRRGGAQPEAFPTITNPYE